MCFAHVAGKESLQLAEADKGRPSLVAAFLCDLPRNLVYLTMKRGGGPHEMMSSAYFLSFIKNSTITKNQITQFKNRQMTWIDISSKIIDFSLQDDSLEKSPHLHHMKRCPSSFSIRKIQIKTTMQCHLISMGMATIKTNKQTNPK